MDDFQILESDVFDALNLLDTSKAMGIDGISPLILKSCALALYEPLCHLFNLTLFQHELPHEWRIRYTNQVIDLMFVIIGRYLSYALFLKFLSVSLMTNASVL